MLPSVAVLGTCLAPAILVAVARRPGPVVHAAKVGFGVYRVWELQHFFWCLFLGFRGPGAYGARDSEFRVLGQVLWA